jgi:hypothetical protein
MNDMPHFLCTPNVHTYLHKYTQTYLHIFVYIFVYSGVFLPHSHHCDEYDDTDVYRTIAAQGLLAGGSRDGARTAAWSTVASMGAVTMVVAMMMMYW